MLLFDLYCPVEIEAVKVSSKIGKMLKKPVPEVVLDLYFNSHVYLVEYAGVTTFVDTSPTCYVSFHYSIYSKVNEADARPAHVA